MLAALLLKQRNRLICLQPDEAGEQPMPLPKGILALTYPRNQDIGDIELDRPSGFSQVMRGLGRDRLRRLILVLHCFLDDSGTDRQSPQITIAGYLASVEQWEIFEADSAKLFRRERIREFHAKQFFDKKDEFSGWDSIRQLAFAWDWFDIASKTVMRGITVSIPKKSYNDLRKETSLNQSISPFGQTFEALFLRLINDNEVFSAIMDRGMSFFVERGNKNNNEIVLWFNELIAKEDYATHFKSLTLIDKGSSFANQLSDYLAFFSRRFAVNFDAKPQMDSFLDLAKEKVKTLGYMADNFELNPAFQTKIKKASQA